MHKEIIGRSQAMGHLLEEVQRVAATDVSVFVGGESGVGKELVARALHQWSRRRDGPFLAVNCGAISEGLQDSELFGHEKGAFTGAQQRHRGVFERAAGGTIFLDEVCELSPATQVRLLRILQERQLTRVGGDETVPVDFRVISATNRDIRAEVSSGRFREDLFYRLVVFPLVVPPLRARLEDIPALVDHFLARCDARAAVAGILPEALDALRLHGWPGNVRELENVIKHATVMAGGDPIGVEHLPPDVLASREQSASDDAAPGQSWSTDASAPMDSPLLVDVPLTVRIPVEGSSQEMLARAEREAILATLLATSGRVVLAARRLGLSRATLYRRLKKYNIDPQQFREATEEMKESDLPRWAVDS